MTVGELKQRLMMFSDEEDIELRCLVDENFHVDDNFYKGYIKDIYKLYQPQTKKIQPVTIELQVQQDLTISQRFDMIGKAIEKAIERNSRELTNIAYSGR